MHAHHLLQSAAGCLTCAPEMSNRLTCLYLFVSVSSGDECRDGSEHHGPESVQRQVIHQSEVGPPGWRCLAGIHILGGGEGREGEVEVEGEEREGRKGGKGERKQGRGIRERTF